MRLTFHGGAREVGRSCIEVETSGHRLLLDCGLKITTEGTEYPIGFEDNKKAKDIDAVFISHAHLDHTGALPWLDHKGMDCQIYCTKGTKALTRILLEDAFKVGKISHQHLGYEQADIKKVLNCMKRAKVLESGTFNSEIKFEFFDAGHIPGSTTVMLESEGKRLLYTGDLKTKETLLHRAGYTDFPKIDILICESTYGDRDHPSREKTQERLIDAVHETLERGGVPIIPVFAVGRAQELIMLLAKRSFGVPIYLDGMGIKVTEAALANPDSLRDAKQLEKAFARVSKIGGYKDRAAALRKGGIFVTTSGMLTGGPVLNYLKVLNKDSKNAILLTGYQGEDTNGRMLLEKGEIYIDGLKTKVGCEVKQFDFSAHDGMADLKELVRKISPKKIIFVHGDEGAVQNMVEWAGAMGYEAYGPELGDIIEV
ncbi:TPA: MBL fold metallo-hydrolase [Candidatus Woesearchaeota archaeon]|nr:MBL fold metallo-hydrolase [Candidatus Woesearchaeota archaeon]